jgi:hypothetical protein
MGSFLDLVEGAVTTAERISDVARRPRPARLPRTPVVRVVTPPNRRAPMQSSEFSIVESIDAETGDPVYIVKNRNGDAATCSSAEFARRVKDSLG